MGAGGVRRQEKACYVRKIHWRLWLFGRGLFGLKNNNNDNNNDSNNDNNNNNDNDDNDINNDNGNGNGNNNDSPCLRLSKKFLAQLTAIC